MSEKKELNAVLNVERDAAQKRIGKQITRLEKNWYKNRDQVSQTARLTGIRKVIEKETNYDY